MRLTLGNFLSLFLGLAALLASPSALSTSARSQTTAPVLNGIAIHSEFGKQQFMGALYSSSGSKSTESLSSAPAMRMELKILAPEGLTLRRFSRMWIESMSVNNSAALLTAQADNMVLFDSLFKDRLQQNDTLVFNYQQSKGVSISLNNVLLGAIADDKFFAMLLRTWIGDVPLSSNFKNAILKAGVVAADVQSRFDSIQPSAERSLEIEKWLGSKPTKALASSSKANGNLAAKSAAATLKPATAISLDTEINPAGKSAAASSTAALKSDRTMAATAAPSVAEKTPVAETKPSLSSQTLLARQFYISQLLKKIRANTRYPKRADELGQSDSVRIALAVDRQGNIISTSFVQGSQYTLLNEAALDAIKKSAPLPPMPDVLSEPSFEFTVPTNFVSGKK